MMHAIDSARSVGLFRVEIGIGSRTAERLLALPAINELYRRIRQRPVASGFAERALEEMGIELTVSPADMERIPRRGPLVVVANHPFGGIDGLALAALVGRVRPDVKIVANNILSAMPEMREMMFAVNAFGDAEAENLRPMRGAVRWVKDGGTLCMFPAGEVSCLQLSARTVTDGQWNVAAARIARIANATILPAFFEGRNSTLFQIAGLVHPRLRTAMLPRELLKHRGRRVIVHLGSTVSPHRLGKFTDAAEATEYLRLRSYLLMGRTDRSARTPGRDAQATLSAIAAPRNPAAMSNEAARLQPLVEAKDFAVYLAAAYEIPEILAEIGRLREATFRLVGEGTGKASDIDRFDAHYRHLFVWNTQHREVVGAYRLGLTDEILPHSSADGLYTNTLFQFRGSLLDQISPAVELGRSFVRVEYQKEYAPLMLLWKGIGHFVAQHPRYRNLIGPVSISADYASLTKQVLMSFLECNARLTSLAKLIVPRNPPRFGPPRDAARIARVVESIEEVDELVAEIEQDRRRVPVLLRQYLKLGAKLLAFNVDPQFGDVLDGLMLVDLLNVPDAILGRYMGSENIPAFRRFHAAT